MCVDRLICKEKISCTGSSAVFTTVGYIDPKIRIVAALVKAAGEYTVTISDGNTILSSVTKSGTGDYDFVILKDLDLPIPPVVS